MLSALIRTELRYPAVPLAGQLVHKRFVHPGPLVLGVRFLNIRRPQQIGDRTVSRRSEPSSRTALIGEQPNPWELLHPQDAMSRHRTLFHSFLWRRLYLHLALDVSRSRLSRDVNCMISVFLLQESACYLHREWPKSPISGKSPLSGQSLRGHDWQLTFNFLQLTFILIGQLLIVNC